MTSEPMGYRVELEDHDYTFVEEASTWDDVVQYLVDHYELTKDREQMVKITVTPVRSAEQVVGQPAQAGGEHQP